MRKRTPTPEVIPAIVPTGQVLEKPAVSRPKRPATVKAPAPAAQLALVEFAPTPSVPAKKERTPRTKAVTVPAPDLKVTPKVPVKAPVTAKRIPVTKSAPTKREAPVRIVPESVFASGSLWRMSGKHGVAYLKDAALAGELLATDTKGLAKAAMAVYYDHKGRAFAWQVRFDTDRWDEVMRRLEQPR